MILTIISRLRQPEYTGENRYVPCTVGNLIIAVVVSRLIAGRSKLAGMSSLSVFTGLIYLRGYLIPGTPTLTKRYFPNWVLRLFNEQPVARLTSGAEIELEAALQRAGAIESSSGDEIRLTESFRTTWLENAESIRNHDLRRSQLAELMDVTDEQLMLTDQEMGTLLVLANGEDSDSDDIIAQWESDAAILADIAAGYELRERSPDWNDFSPQARCYILRGVRAFADTCPACGGTVHTSEGTVDSCCGQTEVKSVHCQNCDSRLLEVPS